MNEDMSDMMSKISQMLNSNSMPDDIKNIVNSLANSQNNNSDISSDNSKRECSNDNNSNNSSFTENKNDSSIPDLDINTILKMKSIMDTMKNQKDDPRANLLMSLKPYLKPSRKQKVDQYVNLFKMGKVIEVLNPLGGDNKNDV